MPKVAAFCTLPFEIYANFLKCKMLKNFNFYIYAILAITLGFLYLRLDSTKARLEKSQSDLALAVEINKNNEVKLKELTQIHKKELKAINEANNQKNEVKERIEYVKEYIYKSNENNLTKLFNGMVDRLWEHNSTSSNQSRNSQSENSTRTTKPKPP